MTVKEIVDRIENINPTEIVNEFHRHGRNCAPDSYSAAVLDPVSGKIDYTVNAGWSCSLDEYFEESGILSKITLLFKTCEHWSSAPEDEFGWDYCGHPADDELSWVFLNEYDGENDEEENDEDAVEWFCISVPFEECVPEEGYDSEVKELADKLSAFVNRILECAEKEIVY